MTHPEANVTVKVDVTNPGQFFACCGLLELADRLWPGAEGWFEDGIFCLVCDESVGAVNQLLSYLMKRPEFSTGVTKQSVLHGSKLKLLPFTITFQDSALQVDWWRDEMTPPDKKKSQETCAKSAFTTWSGNQSPQQIIYDRLLPALRDVIKSEHEDWFFARVPLTGRFGFDHAAAVKAIDVGWSPDEQDIPVATSPCIELLAMIGLQRFRPTQLNEQSSFAYQTWVDAATPLVAVAKVAGLIHDSGSQRFQFTVEERGKYKYFGPATPIGDHP